MQWICYSVVLRCSDTEIPVYTSRRATATGLTVSRCWGDSSVLIPTCSSGSRIYAQTGIHGSFLSIPRSVVPTACHKRHSPSAAHFVRVESRDLPICERFGCQTLSHSYQIRYRACPALRCPGIIRVCLLTAEPSYIDVLDVVLESEETSGTRMRFCPVQH